MTVVEKLERLDILKQEIDALRPIDAAQERRVMDKFRLDWNYNSNAMEGNTLSIGETEALLSYGLTAKGKPLKDHLDIQGHNEVLGTLAELVRDQTPLTEHLIRSLHHAMLKDDQKVSSVNAEGLRVSRTIAAGRYKTQPNQLQTETGAIRRFALPTETPALMADLLSAYAKEKDVPTLHPLLFAARFHHQFVAIHPFDDGNGRLARILMNLILMQRGYLPAILRLPERNAYLAALVQADAGEYEALFDLVTDACIRSAETYINAAQGGAVGDLGYFDKQLALFTQSILAQQAIGEGKEGEPLDHLRVFDVLLTPVFQGLDKRIALLKPLFNQNTLNFTAGFSPPRPGYQTDLKTYITEIRSALSGNVERLIEAQLFYQGSGFVGDPTKMFVVNMHCSFRPRDFSLTLSGMFIEAKEIFRGTYDAVLTSVDVESVLRTSLEKIVDGLTRTTARKPQ